MRLLVVEDHRDTADVMARLLRSNGHDADVATTLAEARIACQEKRFDLVLCDIGLPDGRGEELVITAREFNLKIIALTGYGTIKDLNNFETVGFDAVIIKPASVNQIQAAIDNLCKGRPDDGGDLHYSSAP